MRDTPYTAGSIPRLSYLIGRKGVELMSRPKGSSNKKIKEPSELPKKCCTNCGTSKRLSENFYLSNNKFEKDGRMNVCKSCIKKGINLNDLSSVLNILKMMNRPFLQDQWASAINEAKRKNSDDYFGVYIKTLLFNFKDWTWSDNGTESIEEHPSEPSPELVDIDDDYIEELHRYWGKGYTTEEYQYLEEEKIKLMSSFECPDYGMEMIMRDICFINLSIERSRREKNANASKEITNLIKTRSDLMNDAKMKPIQATGSEANDQMTFGVLIKKWENEKPIPQMPDDEMKKYIDTFMIGHLAKMEGLNNELTERYDAEIAEYTIDFEDIHRQDNFEDE